MQINFESYTLNNFFYFNCLFLVVQSLDTEWLQGESFALEMAHTGESVILKCQLSDPNISVTFFREGKSHRDWEEISPDGQKYSFVGKGKQQLLINNLNLLHDSGQFLCKADGIKIVDKKIQLLIIRGTSLILSFTL